MQVLTLERQQYFLSTVSRTFALTIPLLPKELEDWVGNSYLLCRITDTIEDAVYLDNELKKFHMNKFASLLSSPIGLEQWTKEICELVRSSSNEHENELMAAIPEVVGRYYSYSSEVQYILRHTVTIMANLPSNKYKRPRRPRKSRGVCRRLQSRSFHKAAAQPCCSRAPQASCAPRPPTPPAFSWI